MTSTSQANITRRADRKGAEIIPFPRSRKAPPATTRPAAPPDDDPRLVMVREILASAKPISPPGMPLSVAWSLPIVRCAD